MDQTIDLFLFGLLILFLWICDFAMTVRWRNMFQNSCWSLRIKLKHFIFKRTGRYLRLLRFLWTFNFIFLQKFINKIKQCELFKSLRPVIILLFFNHRVLNHTHLRIIHLTYISKRHWFANLRTFRNFCNRVDKIWIEKSFCNRCFFKKLRKILILFVNLFWFLMF